MVLSPLLAMALAAQVPDGHCVVSTIHVGSGALGGLFIVHPWTPGAPIAVTGLGTDLTGTPSATQGANCVAIDPIDGTLLVGELGPVGTAIDLHEIRLNGVAVAQDVTTPIGVVGASIPGGSGGISQIAVLPSGDLVFGVYGLVAQPPLNGHSLGYFDRASHTVTPIPVTSPPVAGCNSVAVDRTGSLIYATLFNPGQLSGPLYSVPITGGQATVVRLTSTSHLAVRSNGHLLAIAATSQIFDIDPVTSTQTTVALISGVITCVAVERATDAPFAALYGQTSSGPGCFRVNGSQPQLLTTAVPGVAAGIAISDSLREYGTATPGNANYAFAVAPTVGGLPLAGNAQFALRVDATGSAPGLGAMALSFAPTQQPLLGFDLLVDPNLAIVLGLFPPGTAVPLPIPAGFAPMRFFLQSLHLDAGAPQGVASTRGVLLGTIR